MTATLRWTLVACATALGQTQSAAPQTPAPQSAAPQAANSAPRWRVQYFYDQAKSSLVFHDIQFFSPLHGMAIGNIQDGKSRKPAAVVTTDGGEHWSLTPIEDHPISLFLLNDTLGWMVTEHGLWQTTEAGKDWHKLPHPPAQPLRVFFTDANNGWAACLKKAVLATHDGGRHWEPVAVAAEPNGAPDRSAYTWIAFANATHGIITGINQPVQRFAPMFPAWLDPEDALSRRETPHLAYALTTNDGGKTWKTESASLIGRITRVRLAPDGVGLGLIEYADSFRFPSEAYKIDWKTGKNATIFRDKRYAITDVWVTPGGGAFLAGVETTGEVRSVSPGKIKVFQTSDWTTWNDEPVDYRAIAQRVLLAGAGDGVWLATDNGMILRWK